MHRLLAVLLAAAALGAAASSASAADHCRPRPGEHLLARSAQAVVFDQTIRQSQHFPLQTITGCSRSSGKRRVIDTLQRRSADDPTKLIGLKLAGTRIAYAIVLVTPSNERITIMADDAVHSGRRHDLSSGGWVSAGVGALTQAKITWAVDAQGDVAWLTTSSAEFNTENMRQDLGVWRAGLGHRRLDAHAVLGDLTMRDGVVRWRRNGMPRSVDLASVPASRCGFKTADGTLDVDVIQDVRTDWLTVCLRSSGRTITERFGLYSVHDVNGPYVLVSLSNRVSSYTWLADLVTGSTTTMPGTGYDMVVDDHGSIAWLSDGLWVSDANGTRKVADGQGGDGPLLLDGSTVTVANGGPTVTLTP